MIDGVTAVDNKPSATVNSESYFQLSRNMRKVKMVIMGTNIGPEPICTNMRLSIRTTKTVSQYPYDLNVPDVQGAVSKARSLVCRCCWS